MSGDKKRRLPEGWKWETLDKITTNIQYGISKSSTSNKVGPRLLRITDIQDGKVDWNKVPFCECNSNEEKQYLLENNDIVFVRTGATTGKSFLLNNPENTLFASYLIRVQCKKELVNPKYLYTFFQTPIYWNNINQKSRGGTLAGFNASMLSNIEIPLPPTLTDQLTIASDLERRMAHVEKMREAALRQLDAAKSMSAALLNEIFSDETFDGYPSVRLEDWPCEIASGQAVSSVGGNYQKKGIRYIQGNNLTNEGFALVPIVYTEAETHAAMSRSVVKPKDVLINIVGPPIGKICWYPEDQLEANINQAVVRVHCPEDLDYRFLTYLLRTKNYYDYFFEVKVGVRQWNISRTNCADIKIPRVPLSLQYELVKKFEEKIAGNPLVAAAERQLEAIEALPGAILREVFYFEEENIGS